MAELLVASVVDTSLRIAVLAGAVALVLAVFRVRSSRTRHAAWVAVIATMLLMPILTRMVPPIHVRLPESATLSASPRLIPIFDVPTLPDAPESDTRVEPASHPSIAATPTTTAASPEPTGSEPVPWGAVLLAVYVLGAVFLLVRVLVGAFHMVRIRRSSRALAMPDAAPVWESALVATPVTVGPWAPRVILPPGWRDWPSDTLVAVLAHERAHAARRDPLIALIARINVAVFWFHPLAWWLERNVATLAEHAADDAALKRVTNRRYAETLLDIAATVRRHNGRLVWHGVGVDGDGRLGRRIDRILHGRTYPDPSRSRQVLVAASCTAAIAVVIACRQEVEKVPPLREDPELAALVKAENSRVAAYEAGQKMTAQEAAALEKVLEQNPDDDDSRGTLLTYYKRIVRDRQRNWNEAVANLQRHALWLVEHRPDSDFVTRWAYVSTDVDPEGHALLRARWLEHLSRDDVSANLLNNAVYFLSRHDPMLAEKALVRAQTLQPDGPLPASDNFRNIRIPWMERLGLLYASAMGSSDPETRAWARERLESSTNGKVLAEAGYVLAVRSTNREEDRAFGRGLIERAPRFDPGVAERSRELLRVPDPREAMPFTVARMPAHERRQALAKATDGERLELLAVLSEVEYMAAINADRAADPKPGLAADPKDAGSRRDEAAAGFAQSETYARQTLDLAKSRRDSPDYPVAIVRAHIALGLNEFRQGNREEAVRHLLEASKAPAPKESRREWSFLEYRLVNRLLKHGERESVIQYLEQSAPKRLLGERERMLKAAAAIRKGIMPEQYQLMRAGGSL